MGGDDLRVAGADGRDRRPRAARRRRGGRRPLGAPPRRRRRGDRDGRAAGASGTTRRSARSRPASSPTSARATRSSASRGIAPAEPPTPRPADAGGAPRAARARPQLRSRAFVTRRYDQLVQSRTVRRPGSRRRRAAPAARRGAGSRCRSTAGPRRVARPAHRRRARRPRGCPQRRVRRAASRSALTDCLNFGNPEKPEIGWELAEAIEGMAHACEALGVPVVSGNVSLYNDTDGRSIHPTPVVGCVGLVADVRRVPGAGATATRSCSPVAARRSRSPDPSTRRAGARSGGSPSLDLASGGGARARTLTRSRRAPRSSTTSPRAGSPSRSPRRRSGAASARRSSSPTTRSRSSARSGARSSSRCPPATSSRDPTGRTLPSAGSASVGGDSAPRRPARRARASAEGADLMCGVFGVRSDERDVARLAYFGLFALQHRGQESAGIAVSDGGRVTALREMGLVAQVFDEEKLAACPGEVAIGHTRYSTTGGAHWSNAQPMVHHGAAAHGRARAQRQPRQPGAAPRGADRRRRAARVDARTPR